MIDLDDRLTRPLAGMAASVGLVRRNLNDTDRDLVRFNRTTKESGRSIDRLSGRLGLLVDIGATLGPSIIPAAAQAAPLIAGLANQFGFAAIAGGSAILAFQGVGDALKAVNTYALEPSQANLTKMHEAMSQLGPAGQDFVRELASMRPLLKQLESSAQGGLFPGLSQGMRDVTTRMPEVQRIIEIVTSTLGDLAASAGKSLAGPEWDGFFHMVETEARPALMALGESVGQVAKGLADLWVAFTPLNRGFSAGMLEASRSFEHWASSLSQTQGFADFLDYLHNTGPQVAHALAAIGNALLQVTEAVAPLGGPALHVITAFADAIASLANSDLGTPIFGAIAAWRAYSLAVGLAEKAQMRFNVAQSGGFTGSALGGRAGGARSWASNIAKDLGVVTTTWATAGARTERESARMKVSTDRLKTSLSGVGKGAAGLAALGVASTGAADKIGLTNTATLALMGTFVEPGWGTAIGATAGLMLDVSHSGDQLTDTLTRLNAAAAAGNWDAAAQGMASIKKQIDDINHSTSIGDALGDWAKSVSGALHGNLSFGMGGVHLSKGAAAKADAAQAQGDNAARTRGAAIANQQAYASAVLAAKGYTLTAAGAREASQSVSQFAASVDRLSHGLTQQGSLDAYRTALLDFADSLKTNGKTLADNTRKGLANRAALRDIATNALGAAKEMDNFGRRTKFLDNARGGFIKAAEAAGATRAQARKLADAFGLLDRLHPKPKVTEQGADASKTRVQKLRAEIQALKDKKVHLSQQGAEAVQARIAALRAQIAALRDKTVHINVNVSRSGGNMGGAGTMGASIGAYGMLWHGGVRHYAYGDVANRHQPELAGPGMTRIWREPETMGEAYIPLANDDRRPRARAIAAETVGLLGGVAHFANGGINARRGGGNNAHHVNLFADALRRATASLDKEKAARDALISKRNDLTGSVRDHFLSDPFGGGSAWSPGGGSPIAVMKADIAKARAFSAQLARLKSEGLRGDALAAIASTGDIGKAAALAATGKAGVGQYATTFAQRAAAANAAGVYAGNAAYGAAIIRDNTQLVTLNATVHRLEAQMKHRHGENKKANKANAHAAGQATGKAINHAASSAHKKSRRG